MSVKAKFVLPLLLIILLATPLLQSCNNTDGEQNPDGRRWLNNAMTRQDIAELMSTERSFIFPVESSDFEDVTPRFYRTWNNGSQRLSYFRGTPADGTAVWTCVEEHGSVKLRTYWGGTAKKLRFMPKGFEPDSYLIYLSTLWLETVFTYKQVVYGINLLRLAPRLFLNDLSDVGGAKKNDENAENNARLAGPYIPAVSRALFDILFAPSVAEEEGSGSQE
ncbi:MAG: hypothetical protein IJ735_05050 [Clostridia bacterium]|nr:hypothetical protein [Clostridia bacterium]